MIGAAFVFKILYSLYSLYTQNYVFKLMIDEYYYQLKSKLNKFYSNNRSLLDILLMGALIVLGIVIYMLYIQDPVMCDSPNITSLFNKSSIGSFNPIPTNPSPEGIELPVPGRRCPSCLERGDTV